MYVWGGQNGVLDCLGLELEMVMSHYMGAGNRTQTLWKSSHWLLWLPCLHWF